MSPKGKKTGDEKKSLFIYIPKVKPRGLPIKVQINMLNNKEVMYSISHFFIKVFIALKVLTLLHY